jgi:hypothetical protein
MGMVHGDETFEHEFGKAGPMNTSARFIPVWPADFIVQWLYRDRPLASAPKGKAAVSSIFWNVEKCRNAGALEAAGI